MGEIYGLIFASPEPLAFVDIEQKLWLGKGSVSQGLRALRGRPDKLQTWQSRTRTVLPFAGKMF